MLLDTVSGSSLSFSPVSLFAEFLPCYDDFRSVLSLPPEFPRLVLILLLLLTFSTSLTVFRFPLLLPLLTLFLCVEGSWFCFGPVRVDSR